MKCRYTFTIEGFLKPSQDVSIAFDNHEYSFELKDGFLKKIIITVDNYPEICIPQITHQENSIVKAHISIPHDPYYFFIKEEVRNLEGLLSIYGVQHIDTESPEIRLIPENDEERKKLEIFGYKRSYMEQNKKNISLTPIDIIARSLIASKISTQIQVPLSFFRKGTMDVYEKRFIEAIYDYYFMLETCYGNGKTKNIAIKEEFRKSTELGEFIEKVIKNKNTRLINNPKLCKTYKDNYLSKGTEYIISHIVDLRGFLHHHSLKRKDIWHPDKQGKYEVDAIFLQELCFEISFALSERYVFDQETVNKYKQVKIKLNLK